MADSLQHPIHEHALILRHLSENCNIRCFLCTQPFHGPAYCCLECDIFLDESCASIELPLQIQHPAHAEHLLALDGTNSWYRCHGCRFHLFAIDAFMTLPPADEDKLGEEEKERIQHFAHEHPLSPFFLTTQSGSVCKACRLHMLGRVYGCRECMFLLHESCAKLPRGMEHRFHHQHPLTLVADFAIDFGECHECRVCSYRSRFMYQCDECKLNHCIKCTLSTLPPQSEDPEEANCGAIEGPFHQHQLTQFRVIMENNIVCQACQLRISGEVCCCFDCVFFIHKECSKELPLEIKHHLHQEHPHFLQAAAPYNGGMCYCPSCLRGYNGMTFNCESCKFDLDPQCALQTLSAVEGGTASEIQHFSHPHPMTLVHSNEGVNAVNCDACGEPATGLAYCCQRCTIMLHKQCAEVARELDHQFHPWHPLVLLSRAPAEYFYCSACHKKSEGFTFCCTKCEFYLDMECASRKPTLKHERHEHRLAYLPISNKTNRLYCNCCGKSCTRDLYRCVPCNFNIHHDCLPLPPRVEHECHPYHPLVLFDRYVDGRPDDQYCDYCEEIRNPDHGVYRCAECLYTTHIECVIPTVSPHPLKLLALLRTVHFQLNFALALIKISTRLLLT